MVRPEDRYCMGKKDMCHYKCYKGCMYYNSMLVAKKLSDNPYFERIKDIFDRQRVKGVRKYGMGLEDNGKFDILERITYLEEEMVDALMYCEWIKEYIREGEA